MIAAFVLAAPPVAEAHGPVAPVATSYLARVSHVPAGLRVDVVDGYLRMWLQVSAGENVVVLDYRGAPYLRFVPSGVQVNENSSMYYLNRTLPETPPMNLSRTTPPKWVQVSGGHEYEWHDGRLQALSSVAITPGTTYVGRWIIPLRVDGRLTSISGGLWHAGNPSIVWFWPIAVVLLCVIAAWRLRRPPLDERLARSLAAMSLIAFAAGGAARDLHGRPGVTALGLIELAVLLAFVAWGLRRVLVGQPGYFTYLVVAFAALWEGISLISTLRHGFVLLALPAFVVRSATVLCLGAGASLLLLVFRLAGEPVRSARAGRRRERSAAG